MDNYLPEPAPEPVPAILPYQRPVIPAIALTHIAVAHQRMSELLLETARALAILYNETPVPASLLVPLANMTSEINFTGEVIRAVIEENKIPWRLT